MKCQKCGGTELIDTKVSVPIMFSMLIAYTSTNIAYISGVQGRYFIGFAVVFFLGCTTDMIRVDKRHACIVATCMILTEVLTVLSAVGKV